MCLYIDGMRSGVRDDQREPLTFTNAPTEQQDGRLYVEFEAGLELARRIIRDDASLLARLAEE